MEKRPGGGWKLVQGFHLLRTRPGTPDPLLMAKQAGTPDSLVVVAIIEAGRVTSRGPLLPDSTMPFRLLNDTGARHLPAASMMALASGTRRRINIRTTSAIKYTVPHGGKSAANLPLAAPA